MKIKYKSKIKGQDIDIDKLRPNNSYSHLIKNRNGSLQAILDNIEEHKDLLKYRNCPNCDVTVSHFCLAFNAFLWEA